MSFQTVKADLEVKRPTMDKLCSMSQDLLSSVKNKEVASKLEARLDSFTQRWDRLIQSLDSSSSQVLASPHQCVISCNRDHSQGYMLSFIKLVCLQTVGSGFFVVFFLSESNLCSMQTPWGLICAAIKTLLWWNLSHGRCNCHKMTWKNWLNERGDWAPQRVLCVTAVEAIEEGLRIKVCTCNPATTNKHTLIKASVFNDIQCNYVLVITLLSVWLLFTSPRSYFLL